jgi:hypothetical protein
MRKHLDQCFRDHHQPMAGQAPIDVLRSCLTAETDPEPLPMSDGPSGQRAFAGDWEQAR